MDAEIQRIKPRDVALEEIVRRLAEAYHPMRIYLFGSRARGTSAKDSDYDILIVVRDDTPPEKQTSRLAHQTLWGIESATDILVCTEGWFRSRLGVVTSLPAQVIREGKLLYAA